jgi:hypothetical protein
MKYATSRKEDWSLYRGMVAEICGRSSWPGGGLRSHHSKPATEDVCYAGEPV